MEERFSAEEIQKIVQAAHIAAPTFSEDDLEKLFQAEAYLAQPGFVETFWALIQLQKTKGVAIQHALDYCEELMAKLRQLEKAVAKLKQEHDVWQENLKADVQAATRARQERAAAEKDLAAFRKQAEAEKKRLVAEVDKARREAQVGLEEMEETKQLKNEVNSRGLTVKFLLDVCRGLELAPDAVERLSREIEMSNTLAEANISRKQELEASEKLIAQSQEKISQLEKQCCQEEEQLSQLRKDKAREETVHRFYRRFWVLGALVEYLVSWDRIGFVRCKNAFCAARFWVDRDVSVLHLRSRIVCPACGGTDLEGDPRAYGAVGHVGKEFFIKLQLGE